jgi:hypothetical protein
MVVSCDCRNEPLGSIKFWGVPEWLHNLWTLEQCQLNTVSQLVRIAVKKL